MCCYIVFLEQATELINSLSWSPGFSTRTQAPNPYDFEKNAWGSVLGAQKQEREKYTEVGNGF